MVMRMGGLASGMDIDSIVRDLMTIERLRVDKTTQSKNIFEWQREAYNDVNKLFANFVLDSRKAFGLITTSSGGIQNKSVSSLEWVKKASISDPDIGDVKAKTNAINGSYEVFVHNLASNWSAASSEKISKSTDRSSLEKQFDMKSDDEINFTINTDKGEVTIKGTAGKLTMDKIVSQINQADIGVTAIYDSSIDRFFLQTNETGAESTIEINQEGDIEFISKLKLHHSEDVEVETGKKYGGTDALIDFGAAKNISMSSNRFTINNIDFDLKSASLAGSKTVVKIETDEDSIVDKIKGFVDSYNELIDKIGGKLVEKTYRDFPPLTEEQKEDMTEKQIEQWEEKAKSGMLRNDSMITRTLHNMRMGLYQAVEGVGGAFSQLTQIGIETESYSQGQVGGKLVIDDEKLRAAIKEDADGVVELLFKEPDTAASSDEEKTKSTGLVGRMYSTMIDGMKEIITKAGPGEDAQLFRNVNSTMLIDFVTKHSSISMLDESIMDYEKRIFELERRLTDKEAGYWQKFTAMEKALYTMQSQSSWLAQQFGGGQMY